MSELNIDFGNETFLSTEQSDIKNLNDLLASNKIKFSGEQENNILLKLKETGKTIDDLGLFISSNGNISYEKLVSYLSKVIDKQVKNEVDNQDNESDFQNQNYGEIEKLVGNITSKIDIGSLPNSSIKKAEAQENLLKSNPNLVNEPKKLESLTNAYVILSSKDYISEKYPDLKEDLGKLETIGQTIPEFKNIRIENRLQTAPNVLKQEIEQVKASFTPNGEKLEINSKNTSGKTIEFITGDQKVIVSTESELPKKFIQKYGYSIETSQDYGINYEYLRKKQELQTPLEKLKQEQKEESGSIDQLKGFQIKNREVSHENIKDFSKISDNLPNTNQFGELKTIVGDYTKDLQRIQELKQDKTINQTQKAIEIDSLEGLLTSYIERINKALQSLLQRNNQKQEQLNQNISQLNQLEREKEATNSNYTSKQLDKDNQARDTLDFLNYMGITVIKQSDFDKLAMQINQNPTIYGLSKPIDLKEGFSGTVLNANEGKQNFLNLFSKLYTAVGLGQIPTVQDLNENPISKTDFKKGLIQKGFMSNGELKIDKVLSALSK